MKYTVLALILTGVSFSGVANASCENIKSQIETKIINNGVPSAEFTLEILTKEEATNYQGKIVGSCEGDSKKIGYIRGSAASNSGTIESKQTTSSTVAQDKKAPENDDMVEQSSASQKTEKTDSAKSSETSVPASSDDKLKNETDKTINSIEEKAKDKSDNVQNVIIDDQNIEVQIMPDHTENDK